MPNVIETEVAEIQDEIYNNYPFYAGEISDEFIRCLVVIANLYFCEVLSQFRERHNLSNQDLSRILDYSDRRCSTICNDYQLDLTSIGSDKYMNLLACDLLENDERELFYKVIFKGAVIVQIIKENYSEPVVQKIIIDAFKKKYPNLFFTKLYKEKSRKVKKGKKLCGQMTN